jgi:hypothetical protein
LLRFFDPDFTLLHPNFPCIQYKYACGARKIVVGVTPYANNCCIAKDCQRFGESVASRLDRGSQSEISVRLSEQPVLANGKIASKKSIEVATYFQWVWCALELMSIGPLFTGMADQ